MKFSARVPKDKPEVVEVSYNCECGCKPRARYERDTTESGHQQCCCGQLHFVGGEATQHLKAYVAEKQATGQDTRHYTLYEEDVKAPWGKVPVAFGVPDQLTEH